MATIYVTIGNSDDKLTQRQWSRFQRDVDFEVYGYSAKEHGKWTSYPDAEWQNAAWCFDIKDHQALILKESLSSLASTYGQDSIVWAEAQIELLAPPREG